jgi:hypothetical protein
VQFGQAFAGAAVGQGEGLAAVPGALQGKELGQRGVAEGEQALPDGAFSVVDGGPLVGGLADIGEQLPARIGPAPRSKELLEGYRRGEAVGEESPPRRVVVGTLAENNRLAKPWGKNHTTITADLGMPDDRPTQALFEFVGGVLKK